MIRFYDFILAFVGIILLTPLFVAIYLLGFCMFSRPIFSQVRMGQNMENFTLYKFRTMPELTPDLPSHLVNVNSSNSYCSFLRKTKLDELPQLYNVLIGNMSLVGYRPCLPTQTELIAQREKLGVHKFKPGVTGLSQIQGIDMSTPALLAHTDAKMLSNFTFRSYISLIFLTLIGKGQGDRIK